MLLLLPSSVSVDVADAGCTAGATAGKVMLLSIGAAATAVNENASATAPPWQLLCQEQSRMQQTN
jgi:hypothetical protein